VFDYFALNFSVVFDKVLFIICLSFCLSICMSHKGHVTVVTNHMRGMSQWQLAGQKTRILMLLRAVFDP